MLIFLLLPFAFASVLSEPSGPAYDYAQLNPPCGSSLRSQIMKTIFCNYDKDVRPPPGDTPTIITVNAGVESITSVYEYQYTWSLTLYYGESWMDPRLQYENLLYDCPNFNYIALTTPDTINSIWSPDSSFSDSVGGQVANIVRINQGVRVYPDGTVMKSTYAELILYCPCDKSSPCSTVCSLLISSYFQDVSDLIYVWDWQNPIQQVNPYCIPYYTLESIQPFNTTQAFASGSYSTAVANFTFMKTPCSGSATQLYPSYYKP